MEKVERYFHIRPQVFRPPLTDGGYVLLDGKMLVASRGGATVRVVGDNESVIVQYALCSKNDAYCRKTGRQVAKTHPEMAISTAQLPKVLQEIAREVPSRVLELSRNKRTKHHLWDTDFSFATKYFQPKQQ